MEEGWKEKAELGLAVKREEAESKEVRSGVEQKGRQARAAMLVSKSASV